MVNLKKTFVIVGLDFLRNIPGQNSASLIKYTVYYVKISTWLSF